MFELRLVTVRSGLPLPSRSPMAKKKGFDPVVKSTLVAKLLVVMLPLLEVLRKTEIWFELAFSTARSDLPFPSRSPMATEQGLSPAVKSTLAAKLPGVILPLLEVLRKTETLPVVPFATARSGLPSPSRSPMAIERGAVPVVKSTLAAKLTVPLLEVVLRSTETVLGPKFATARSDLPSPSRSRIAKE